MSYWWNYNANQLHPTLCSIPFRKFTNINSIYQSYEPTIQMAIQLLRTEPVLDKLTTADNPQPKRSPLPSLGYALYWLTRMDTMKDTTEIKWQVNLLIQEQIQQHIISILNITWNTTQVNRQKLNEVMDALQKANDGMNILFNITDILMQCMRYHQIYTLCPHFIGLPQGLSHIHETSCHIQWIMWMQQWLIYYHQIHSLLRCIKAKLPSIIHLPMSLDNTLHFINIWRHMCW